jgi:hypothetical protein
MRSIKAEDMKEPAAPAAVRLLYADFLGNPEPVRNSPSSPRPAQSHQKRTRTSRSRRCNPSLAAPEASRPSPSVGRGRRGESAATPPSSNLHPPTSPRAHRPLPLRNEDPVDRAHEIHSIHPHFTGRGI